MNTESVFLFFLSLLRFGLMDRLSYKQGSYEISYSHISAQLTHSPVWRSRRREEVEVEVEYDRLSRGRLGRLSRLGRQ